jgi:DNA anti-recombination protein RmuC
MEITRNAIAIREAGEKLYEKLATAQDYFGKMGKALMNAVAQYNNLVGCIESSRGVFSQARKLHEHGISRDELPEVLPLESATRVLQDDDWSHPQASLRLYSDSEGNSGEPEA